MVELGGKKHLGDITGSCTASLADGAMPLTLRLGVLSLPTRRGGSRGEPMRGDPGAGDPGRMAAAKAGTGRLPLLCAFTVENWKHRNVATVIKPNREHPFLPQNADMQAWLNPQVSSLPVD